MISAIPTVQGILPQGQLDITPGNGKKPYTLFASLGNFGSIPPMTTNTKHNPNRILTLPPSNNAHLCDNVTSSTISSSTTSRSSQAETIMVVPRGECTFERKAWNAQLLGANAIIIYGNLASHYSVNKTEHQDEKYPQYSTDDIIWPSEYYDYDCNNGRAEIPIPDISLSPLPYNSIINDPILTGSTDDNLCHLYSPSNLRQCASNRCLLTGKKVDDTSSTGAATSSSSSNDHSKYEVCCAWDLHIFLYSDSQLHKEMPNVNVTIPAAFITMSQSQRLLQDMKESSSASSASSAILSIRYQPQYNISSMLIWMLGVIVCSVAAYMSANDYHYKAKRLIQRRLHYMSIQNNNQGGGEGAGPAARSRQQVPQPPQPQLFDDSMELTPMHALGFIIMASSGLMILFYFKVRNVVRECVYLWD